MIKLITRMMKRLGYFNEFDT